MRVLTRRGNPALWKAAIVAVLATGLLTAPRAQQSGARARELDPVVVTGQRIASDEAVVRQVQIALSSNPVLDDRHVTISAKDSVVTLSGFVQDAWDLIALRRVARRTPGVKRIVNDVELVLNDQ